MDVTGEVHQINEMSTLDHSKDGFVSTKQIVLTDLKDDQDVLVKTVDNKSSPCSQNDAPEMLYFGTGDEQRELFVGNLRIDVEQDLVVAKLQSLFSTENVELTEGNFSLLQHGANKVKQLFVMLESRDDLEKLVRRFDGLGDPEIVAADRTLKVCPKNEKPGRKRRRGKRGKGSTKKKEIVATENHEHEVSSLLGTAKIRPCLSAPDVSKPRENATALEESRRNTLAMGQILQNEDRTIEYKRGGGQYPRRHMLNDIRKYACAFLNSEGGRLLIGVADNGQVFGISCNRKEEDTVRIHIDNIISRFHPPVFPASYSVAFIPVLPNADYLPMDGNEHCFKVLVVRIMPPPAKRAMCLYETDRGEVYIRRDGSVQGPLKPNQIIEWCKFVQAMDFEPQKVEGQVIESTCKRQRTEWRTSEVTSLSLTSLQENSQGSQIKGQSSNYAIDGISINGRHLDFNSLSRLCEIEANIRERQENIEKEIGLIKDHYSTRERALQVELEKAKCLLKKERRKRRPKSATCIVL